MRGGYWQVQADLHLHTPLLRSTAGGVHPGKLVFYKDHRAIVCGIQKINSLENVVYITGILPNTPQYLLIHTIGYKENEQ